MIDYNDLGTWAMIGLGRVLNMTFLVTTVSMVNAGCCDGFWDWTLLKIANGLSSVSTLPYKIWWPIIMIGLPWKKAKILNSAGGNESTRQTTNSLYLPSRQTTNWPSLQKSSFSCFTDNSSSLCFTSSMIGWTIIFVHYIVYHKAWHWYVSWIGFLVVDRARTKN